MLDQHITQPSSAPAYSQVLLVPESDGVARFCINVRALNLNKIYTVEGWPIPNIEAMLRNIGSAKP